MLLLKLTLFCLVAPALLLWATLHFLTKTSNASLAREKAAALAAAPDFLDGAEPLTHDDLEMAVSDRMRTVLQTHQFVHGKVVWSRRSGQVWDTWVAFDDERRQRHVLRLRGGDGVNLADPSSHLLGRSYIVAYDTVNPRDSKMLQFVSPPASCVTAQRSRA